MHFGTQLHLKRHEPWALHYFDYNALKTFLEQPPVVLLLDVDNDLTSSTRRSTFSRSSAQPSWRRNRKSRHIVPSFLLLLGEEIEKVVHFFLQQQGELSFRLTTRRSTLQLLLGSAVDDQQSRGEMLMQPKLPQSPLPDLTQYTTWYEEYQDMAQQLLHLVQYVDLNLTALRKILKKHDKIAGGNLTRVYLGGSRHYNSHYDGGGSLFEHRHKKKNRPVVTPLLENGGLEALYSTLQTSFLELDALRSKVGGGGVTPRRPAATLDRWNTWNEEMSGGQDDSCNFHVTQYDNDDVATGGAVQYGTTSQSERLVYLPHQHHHHHHHHHHQQQQKQQDSTSRPLLASHTIMLLQIQMARRNLQRSSNFVQLLATSAMLDSSDPVAHLPSDEVLLYSQEEESSLRQQQQQQRRRRQISNALNFCSAFLHMTDYFIVAPTSGMYAKRLGSAAALAGLIIGLNSVAALASTILYSYWTTYSYKQPLVFATTCQLVGCLVYASALPLQSFSCVIVGRLIGGFGSARSINRRYIADTYPLADRTAASAAFVTAGALGTSAGPALASLLYLMVPQDSDNLYWQVENAPGWTMATLWFLYVTCLVLYFEEPARPRRPSTKQVTTWSTQTTGLETEASETQSLVVDDFHDGGGGGAAAAAAADNTTNGGIADDPPLWRVVPVVTTFLVYFTLKFILESLLSSTAILTEHYFGWGGNTSGIYLAILGLLVLPANWLVSEASQRYDDRDLILVTSLLLLLGCLVILPWYQSDPLDSSSDPSDSNYYSVRHYVLGSVIIFVSANALEGPNMSLLSKTIPSRYRHGLFNVGLLSTEAGTLGRAVGDVILTLCGSSRGGVGNILNSAFGAMSILSAGTITLCLWVYDELESLDKDEM